MDKDGGRVRQVTSNGKANFGPFFHPDGERILYSSNVLSESGREFDRFGIIRGAQRTYVRGGTVEDTRANFCDSDADCGIGGYCNLERNICLGGLTSDYGETDFMAFYRSRHNFWVDSLTDISCLADWECDGRYGTDGGVGVVVIRQRLNANAAWTEMFQYANPSAGGKIYGGPGGGFIEVELKDYQSGTFNVYAEAYAGMQKLF